MHLAGNGDDMLKTVVTQWCMEGRRLNWPPLAHLAPARPAPEVVQEQRHPS